MAGNWTPGPWHLDGYNLSAVIHKVSQKGAAGTYECIAQCSGNDWGENWGPNARLISAAPDFADAAANVIANALTIPDPRMGGSTDVVAIPFDDFDALQAAYHKARGDQPDSDPPVSATFEA